MADEAGELTFHAWWRPGISRLAHASQDSRDGRLAASASLELHQRTPGDDEVSAGTGTPDFLLAGPRDVAGLRPGAVTHRYPKPGVPDAEVTMQPYAEFRDAGLPWRYIPEVNPAAGSSTPLRPWLVLVVGPRTEIEVRDGLAKLSATVCDAHPLADAARHGHVQLDEEGVAVARLLSPRQLKTDMQYVAALVAVYADDDGDWGLAWADRAERGGVGATVPCYDHWRFQTGASGDFRSLARRLAPYDPGTADLGVAAVDYPRLDGAPGFTIRGALAPLGSTGAPSPDAIVEHVARLRTPATDDDAPDGDGRPVVGLPRYGGLWADVEDTTWGESLNTDPRHRGVAGLGARLAFEEQLNLADEVGRQAGALDAADQHVRDLACGLTASSVLWDRRVPDDPARQLALFGPGLRRVMTTRGALSSVATWEGRPLPVGWFSTAARRALRRGPARTALARADASDPAQLWEVANGCPPPEPYAEAGVPPGVSPAGRKKDLGGGKPGGKEKEVGQRVDLKQFGPLFEILVEAGADLRQLDRLRDLLGRAHGAGGPLPLTSVVLLVVEFHGRTPDAVTRRQLQERLDQLMKEFARSADDPTGTEELRELLVEPGTDPAACDPVHLGKLAAVARDAFDPRHPAGHARRRVLGSIEGIDPDQPLSPLEFCPGLDVPVWEWLDEHRPEWLLPGLGSVPDDSVFAVQTNARFTDALLAGFNTELLGQLRWRNLRIASGCTPVRTFWNRVDPSGGEDGGPARLDDITGLGTWREDRDLGDPAHRPPGVSGDDLVVVFQGQLLVRYPNTLVYLVDAAADPGSDGGAGSGDGSGPIWPTLRGRLGSDAVYVGFPGLDEDDLTSRTLVLEEAPTGYRFRNDVGSLQDDGARYATATFAAPVRVLIDGAQLLPGGGG